MPLSLARSPLRADVHRELLERIVRARYIPGQRLRDTALARELDVSRTPIREALLRLEREGFVESRQGRGFVVRPLTREEIAEVYPLISALEVFALRSRGSPAPAVLSRMETLGQSMLTSKRDPALRADLDTRWHALLISGCANQRLVRLLAEWKQVVRRYELAFMTVEAWVATSAGDHAEILRALRRGGARAAIPVLERHWKLGMESVLEQCP